MATYPDGTLLQASGPEIGRMEGVSADRYQTPQPSPVRSECKRSPGGALMLHRHKEATDGWNYR